MWINIQDLWSRWLQNPQKGVPIDMRINEDGEGKRTLSQSYKILTCKHMIRFQVILAWH